MHGWLCRKVTTSLLTTQGQVVAARMSYGGVDSSKDPPPRPRDDVLSTVEMVRLHKCVTITRRVVHPTYRRIQSATSPRGFRGRVAADGFIAPFFAFGINAPHLTKVQAGQLDKAVDMGWVLFVVQV